MDRAPAPRPKEHPQVCPICKTIFDRGWNPRRKYCRQCSFERNMGIRKNMV